MAKDKESALLEKWNVTTGNNSSIATGFKEVVSTGNRFIDYLIGGGILRGKINELYGREGCGKTTLALHIVKKFQDLGGTVHWITPEVSWDKERAETLGVDTSKVFVAVPECIEDGFDYCLYVLNQSKKQENPAPTLIVWDGINASTSRKVIETGSFYAGGVAERARLIAEFFRIATVPFAKNDITLIVNNHVMNSISSGPYGKEYVNPGGNVLKHLVSLRLFMDWKGRKDTHQTVKLVLEKTRNKEPNVKAEVLMSYNLGFDEAYQVVDMAVSEMIVRRYRNQIRFVSEELVFEDISEFLASPKYEEVFNQVFEVFKASIG